MKIIDKLTGQSEELADLIHFLWKVKLWFLIPFILILIAFGLLLVFAQTTGIAPFIYSII